MKIILKSWVTVEYECIGRNKMFNKYKTDDDNHNVGGRNSNTKWHPRFLLKGMDGQIEWF